MRTRGAPPWPIGVSQAKREDAGRAKRFAVVLDKRSHSMGERHPARVRVHHRRRSTGIAQSVRSSLRRGSLDESERWADALAEKLLTDGGDIGDDEDP